MGYVLVTGGAKGLGAEIVKIFAKNNYDVIIGYLNSVREANKLCEEINNKYNVNCIVNKIDITNEHDVKNVFDKYKIDIVINNASLCNDNYISDKTYKDFMKVINVNLGGLFLMCKYSSNVKTIVNISSKDGIDTYNPISLDYCCSKAGIINFSKNLSLYYKDKKILCICPAWIDTNSVKEMNPLYLKKELERTGQKKLLKKEKVAKKIFDCVNSNIMSGSVVIIND